MKLPKLNAHNEAPITESEEDFIDLERMEAEDGDEDLRPGSVVKSGYKLRYRTRAQEMARKPKDVAKKALERSCCDWLAIELAKRVLTTDKKPKLIVPQLEAILDANGVDHRKWNRTTPGWQGRLRMTGRLALQRVVAESGELQLGGGDSVAAPKNWVARHQH